MRQAKKVLSMKMNYFVNKIYKKYNIDKVPNLIIPSLCLVDMFSIDYWVRRTNSIFTETVKKKKKKSVTGL